MKNLNRTIAILAVVSRYGIVIYLGYLASQLVWWLANPLSYTAIYTTTQEAKYLQQKPELIAQGITNRAPFGVISVEKASEPSIFDQIKLVGLYAGGPKNSIAFLQIDGKNSIAQIGDKILDGTLVAVKSQSIIINRNQQNVTLNLTMANQSAGSSNNNFPSGNLNHANMNNNQSQVNTMNQSNSNLNTASGFQVQPEQNNPGSSANSNANNNQYDSDSIAERRRKLIEQFQQQNAAGR